MKKIFALLLVMVLLCSGCKSTTLSFPKIAPKDNTNLSKSITDFTLCIDGDVFSFPTESKALSSAGWQIDKENAEVTLKSKQYISASASKGEKRIVFYFVNFSRKKKAITDCDVCGVKLSSADNVSAALYGENYLSYAKDKDIVKAFGGNIENNKIVYDAGENSKITLGFKNSLLDSIDMYNIVDFRSVSKKPPKEVKGYKHPNDLSDDIRDFTFYLSGNIYTYPLPVYVLIKDGFIKAGGIDGYVLPGETVKKAIKLTKLNRTYDFTVKNISSVATTVQNCVITKIESTYSKKLDLTLANGVRAGAYESALSVFNKKHFTDIKTDKKHKTYIYEDSKHGIISIRVNRETEIVNKIKIEYK